MALPPGRLAARSAAQSWASPPPATPPRRGWAPPRRRKRGGGGGAGPSRSPTTACGPSPGGRRRGPLSVPRGGPRQGRRQRDPEPVLPQDPRRRPPEDDAAGPPRQAVGGAEARAAGDPQRLDPEGRRPRRPQRGLPAGPDGVEPLDDDQDVDGDLGLEGAGVEGGRGGAGIGRHPGGGADPWHCAIERPATCFQRGSSPRGPRRRRGPGRSPRTARGRPRARPPPSWRAIGARTPPGGGAGGRPRVTRAPRLFRRGYTRPGPPAAPG